MSPSGSLSDIVFGIDHSSLKKALQYVWDDYSQYTSIDRSLSEVELFIKVFENFLRSTLGKDALALLRITGYQIMLAEEAEENYNRWWILTGNGPAVVTFTPENPDGRATYIQYPFELSQFTEDVLVHNDYDTSEVMKIVVDSINSIAREATSSAR